MAGSDRRGGGPARRARQIVPHWDKTSRTSELIASKAAQTLGSTGGGRYGTTFADALAMLNDKRILVVDDNLVIQDILKQFLGREYTVDVAGSASQALAAVVQKSPDAILLDINLPGVDGLSLLTSLRDIGVKTPIFVMTGYDSTEFGREALERGATGYLAKPFSLAHIDKLIADAVTQPVA